MASGWNLWVWLECIGVVSGCCCKEVYRYPHNNYLLGNGRCHIIVTLLSSPVVISIKSCQCTYHVVIPLVARSCVDQSISNRL